jgi:flagellar hook-associated protein 1 FlgK
MLSSALFIAGNGLRAFQRQSDIVAHNIANAQTEGFVRKESPLIPNVVAGRGQGVYSSQVRRAVDEFLQRDERRETALGSFHDTRADSLDMYVQTLGKPEDERSVSSRMSVLQTAFQRLANTPESASLQRETLLAAQNLATSFRDSSQMIRQLREDADAGIAREVADVNSALQQVEKLTRDIGMRMASGDDFSEVEDARDRLMDSINDKLPIRVIRRPPGDVVILTQQGTTLMDGHARRIEFRQTTQIDPTLTYVAPGGTPGTGYISGLSGLTVDGRDITPKLNDPQAIRTGSIAGRFNLRDTTLVKMQYQLDEVASALADRMQASDASLGVGVAGLFTDNGARHDRAVAASIPGLANRIQVNTAVDPDNGGYLWRLRDGVGTAPVGVPPASPNAPGYDVQARAFVAAFTNQVTFPASTDLASPMRLTDAAREVVSLHHLERTRAVRNKEDQEKLADSLRTARESSEGVNVDEELQKIMVIEKTYAANAQVIQAATDMLDILLRR